MQPELSDSWGHPLRILVIRLSSIGDIILTTPVLKALRERYPHARIDYLVMDRFKDAIAGVPWIDNLILFPRESCRGVHGLVRFANGLARNRYDMVIDLHAKFRSRIISKRLGARVLRYRKRVWWKSILVPLRLTTYHVDDTIVRNYFRSLAQLGIHYTEEKLFFLYEDSDLAAVPALDDFVVMAPGAANETKKWPLEYFGQLGCRIDGTIALVGGKAEFAALETIRQAIGGRCENLAGKLSLKESGALMSRARFVVTNDSGPFHISRGVGTKAFVLFGPTDPAMFTYDKNTVLLYEGISCSPCSLHGDRKCPRGHFRCMLNLTPDKVMRIIRQHLPKDA
jgi:ADP-heptose:LPS heptosyltransferase